MTPRTKSALEAAADKTQVPVSVLLRGLIGQAIDGRTTDDRVREDLLTVRAVSCTLLDMTEAGEAGTLPADRVADLAKVLHALATRHLGPMP